jgi:hypothetical protein
VTFVKIVVDELAVQLVFLRVFFLFSPANHSSTIAAYSYMTASSYVLYP